MILKNFQLDKMWKNYLLLHICNIYVFVVVKDFEFILLCDYIIAEGLILTAIIVTGFLFSLEPHP